MNYILNIRSFNFFNIRKIHVWFTYIIVINAFCFVVSFRLVNINTWSFKRHVYQKKCNKVLTNPTACTIIVVLDKINGEFLKNMPSDSRFYNITTCAFMNYKKRIRIWSSWNYNSTELSDIINEFLTMYLISYNSTHMKYYPHSRAI